MLTPLQATQHLLGPIAVSFAGDDRAEARCHVRAWHYAPGLADGDEWMACGHYMFMLTRSNSGWLISKMTLELFYQTGNTAMLQQAQQQ